MRSRAAWRFGVVVLSLILLGAWSSIQLADASAPAEPLWIREFGTTGWDDGLAISINADAVFVAGYVGGSLPGKSSAGLTDAYVREYDFDGNEGWTSQFGSDQNDQATAVFAFGSAVYVAGMTNDELPGQTTAGLSDAFLRKYDTGGTELWTHQFGTSSWDGAKGVVADATGVYVVGTASDAFPGQTHSGSEDAFVRKYDAGGTELWTREFGSGDPDEALSVAADSSGIYVVGLTYAALPGQANQGLVDAFLRKYDSAGTELWTRQFGTSEWDQANGVVSHGGGVYVAGWTTGALPGQSSSGQEDGFLRRYDTGGTELWTHQFGTYANDDIRGVAARTTSACDTEVYVAGQRWEYYVPEDPLRSQVIVRKFDSGGDERWAQEFGTSKDDWANGVALNAQGAYVTGATTGTFPGQPHVYREDPFVARLNEPPIPDFTWAPLISDEGQIVSFQDASLDCDGSVVAWLWDMGDGDTYTTPNVVHAYGDNGVYTVNLTVWDDKGAFSWRTESITVANVPPTIEFLNSTLFPNQPRTHGYWKRQCDYGPDPDPMGLPPDHVGIQQEYLDYISAHSLVWSPATFSGVCADLSAGQTAPMLLKLRMQLVALWLNVAADFLSLDSPLHATESGAPTVWGLIQMSEAAIISRQSGPNPPDGELEKLKNDTDRVNNADWAIIDPVVGIYEAFVFDPGSDDIRFDWDFNGDAVADATVVYYNAGGTCEGPSCPFTDPYPSSHGVFPVVILDRHVFGYPSPPPPLTVHLTVSDDDGGVAIDEDPGDPWSADLTFTYTTASRQIFGGFIVPEVTTTYLDWDSVVVRLDPYSGVPFGQ